MGLKDLIQEAIEDDYLRELWQERVAYLNVTAFQMLAHLHACWGMVDFVSIDKLIAKVNTPWSVVEVPTIYFTRVVCTVKQLAREGVPWDCQVLMIKTLKCFKDCGNFDQTEFELESPSPHEPNLGTYMKYVCVVSQKHKQTGLGFGSISNMVNPLSQSAVGH